MAAMNPAPVFDWLDHFMALAGDGGMRDIGKLRRLAPHEGWLVGIKAAASDADVHGDVWERHLACLLYTSLRSCRASRARCGPCGCPRAPSAR